MKVKLFLFIVEIEGDLALREEAPEVGDGEAHLEERADDLLDRPAPHPGRDAPAVGEVGPQLVDRGAEGVVTRQAVAGEVAVVEGEVISIDAYEHPGRVPHVAGAGEAGPPSSCVG